MENESNLSLFAISPAEERKLIAAIAHFGRKNYYLRNNLLEHELSFFLHKIIGNRYAYPVTYQETMLNIFKDEMLLARELARMLNMQTGYYLTDDELFFLMEILIKSNWQLVGIEDGPEKFYTLIADLAELVMQDAKIERAVFYAENHLLNHLKFLAYKILKEALNQEPSDDELYFYMKTHYELAFAMANKMRVFVTERFDFDLSNNDITFLTLQIEKCLRYGVRSA